MDNATLLEFYQYSLFKKLETMEPMQRSAFMVDLFGKKWIDVYETLCVLYPSLNNI